MSNRDRRARKADAATPPTASAVDTLPDHQPVWRSVGALADSLNAGATRPTFTEHSIRHYVRFAETNGLAPHIRRLGSKILIDEVGFLLWIAGQGREVA